MRQSRSSFTHVAHREEACGRARTPGAAQGRHCSAGGRTTTTTRKPRGCAGLRRLVALKSIIDDGFLCARYVRELGQFNGPAGCGRVLDRKQKRKNFTVAPAIITRTLRL